MSRRSQRKLSAIIYMDPESHEIAVFRAPGNAEVKRGKVCMFKRTLHEPANRPLPVPQFCSDVADAVATMRGAPTEGAIWSALFNEDQARQLDMDDFISVIDGRNALESIF
jgi:hypothetical protein